MLGENSVTLTKNIICKIFLLSFYSTGSLSLLLFLEFFSSKKLFLFFSSSLTMCCCCCWARVSELAAFSKEGLSSNSDSTANASYPILAIAARQADMHASSKMMSARAIFWIVKLSSSFGRFFSSSCMREILPFMPTELTKEVETNFNCSHGLIRALSHTPDFQRVPRLASSFIFPSFFLRAKGKDRSFSSGELLLVPKELLLFLLARTVQSKPSSYPFWLECDKRRRVVVGSGFNLKKGEGE